MNMAGMEVIGSEVMDGFSKDIMAASLKILSPATHTILSTLLDSRKVLISSERLHRDWRGVAESARFDVASLTANSQQSYVSHAIHRWEAAGGTVQHLLTALVRMDRHDVIHDMTRAVGADYERVRRDGLMCIVPPHQSLDYQDENILTIHDRSSLFSGGCLTHYDALLLHADEDIAFVKTMLAKLEGEYGLKICVKDRDLVAGLQFESASVARLITERCSRVIVLLSNAFARSPHNTFFTMFAHALSIDQRRRIVIPCRIEPCERPNVIHFCHSLDYFKAHGYWDYWLKLKESISSEPIRKLAPVPPAQISDLSKTHTNFAYPVQHSSTTRFLLQPTQEVSEQVTTVEKENSVKERPRSKSSNFGSLFSKKKKKKEQSRSVSESGHGQHSPTRFLSPLPFFSSRSSTPSARSDAPPVLTFQQSTGTDAVSVSVSSAQHSTVTTAAPNVLLPSVDTDASPTSVQNSLPIPPRRGSDALLSQNNHRGDTLVNTACETTKSRTNMEEAELVNSNNFSSSLTISVCSDESVVIPSSLAGLDGSPQSSLMEEESNSGESQKHLLQKTNNRKEETFTNRFNKFIKKTKLKVKVPA